MWLVHARSELCPSAGSTLSATCQLGPRFRGCRVFHFLWALHPMSMRPFPGSGSPILYSHAALRRLVGRRRDTSEHSVLRSLSARRAARSMPRATIDVSDRGRVLPHIREDCAWTRSSHRTRQLPVRAWGILNFFSSIIVWRSARLSRAGVSDLCQTFLHRLHVATWLSVGCSLESVCILHFLLNLWICLILVVVHNQSTFYFH